MCDCPANKEEINGDRETPETVTLFKKCSKSYRSTKDITGKTSCDTVSDKDNWYPADSSWSDLGLTICHGTKVSPVSSISSSDTRTVNTYLI